MKNTQTSKMQMMMMTFCSMRKMSFEYAKIRDMNLILT